MESGSRYCFVHQQTLCQITRFGAKRRGADSLGVPAHFCLLLHIPGFSTRALTSSVDARLPCNLVRGCESRSSGLSGCGKCCSKWRVVCAGNCVIPSSWHRGSVYLIHTLFSQTVCDTVYNSTMLRALVAAGELQSCASLESLCRSVACIVGILVLISFAQYDCQWIPNCFMTT